MRKYYYLLIVFSPLLTLAQQKNLPLNQQSFQRTESMLSRKGDITYHSAVKPIIESNVGTYNLQGACGVFTYYDSLKRSWLARKVKHESLVVLKDSSTGMFITIDPVFNLEYDKDNNIDTGKYYQNTRGLLVRGDIGTKFSFESSFYENQAFFVNYVDSFVRANEVVPGQGRVKAFKTNGFDYAMASGYISYSPFKKLILQMGHGKHFIGDGYRSLLLSDNAFNYPYVRATTSIGKFQFTNILASLQLIDNGRIFITALNEPLFQKKTATFHYVSYMPVSKVQFGLFQSTMYNVRRGYSPTFNANYVNPFILSSAMQFGLSSNDNVMLGATAKFNITRFVSVYGQYVVDDVDSKKMSTHNKNGYQIGLKYHDAFKLKNLYLQAEYNSVSAFTYSFRKPEQNYTHYNQSLAHPLGANFNEVVGILRYSLLDFFIEAKINYATYGADSVYKHYGNNVLLPDDNAGVLTDNKIQGFSTTLSTYAFSFGYKVNRATNMNIVAGVYMRTLNNAFQHGVTDYFFIGFRTSLSNTYFDF